ncbi:alpha-ketoglutarate-dependent taurine dioxygenase isoform X2 [Aplysia californica]|nr:alpha-ketoglutarate-dependent taurine dioxygenase isoform X2 [Aplysia californica]XP_035827342.1 alpha-ketoglutarate-dependent taurine dioxygenase isoform X2 [Aplysia californica]XP_035827343.1 alpha-ketoglutarate-dependent taurine dioxygenase isoform X2 [Aplysia californica]
MASSIAHTPAKIGIEVRGVDLKSEQSKDIIEKIKSDVHKHRLVIFKDQGQISGARHVQISEWFGDIESTFYKHPKSPHPDVFRVSNDEREGCRNVGRTGWHIDGSFMMEPFNYAIYHMVSIPKTGATAFIGFEELLNSLSPERRASWERLWMVGNSRDVVHPLIYSHPVTRKPVLCFHLGMIGCFIWNYGSKHQRVTDRKETIKILQEIHGEIVKEDEKLVYKHNWEPGDFIISDNRAVGHEATPETQFPVSDVGLRVLHRTTLAGTSKPKK